MNSLNGVTVIGLTGPSGSGKTTVSNAFESCGFSVINADLIARKVTQSGSECMKMICQVFPECCDSQTGELDRSKMAQVVFNSSDMMLLYSSIIYPYITTEILAEIRSLGGSGKKLILLDAPTLYEAKVDDFCNYVVSVIADYDVRLARIIERDKLTREQIISRFNSQPPDEFYISRSDIVIKNEGSEQEFITNAENLADKIKEIFDGKGQ